VEQFKGDGPKEIVMKRMQIVLLVAVACLCVTSPGFAQLGMNIFNKPNISDIFKPVVGSGGLYEMQRTGKEKPTQMEMTIVGKEMVDGQQGWWMEVGHEGPKSASGELMYSKMLVTNEFEMKKIVFQMPGQPAMEMPFDSKDKTNNHMKDEMQKWHKVGSESITVPAGTFSCAHWKKDEGVGDVWVSDKVTPMGMVKSVNDHETMVLVKIINGATDHITGPVSKFDPQAFGRQAAGQKQQNPQ
jgi:hypothetical protein